jgi:transcriptional regulator with XRE-family HTH domain
MQKDQFLAEMKLLDPVLQGRGQEIAKEGGVSYNTYLNYRQGRGNDSSIMLAILSQAKRIAREVKHHLNSINI